MYWITRRAHLPSASPWVRLPPLACASLSNSTDHLFAPDYYYDLREWANSKRPWPFSTSRLAEFYAWYAIMSEDADVSSAKSKWEGAVPAPLKHRKIETCMRSAQRALELANYLEEPDLPCIRALSLIAFRFSCSAPTTDHVPRGLATATTAIALAQQLDLVRCCRIL